jgi:hypothetical protein
MRSGESYKEASLHKKKDQRDTRYIQNLLSVIAEFILYSSVVPNNFH